MSRVQGYNNGFEILRARFQGPGFRGLGSASALNTFTIFFLLLISLLPLRLWLH